MMTRREMNTALSAALVAALSGTVAALRPESAEAQQSSQENAPPNLSREVTTLMHESIGDIVDSEAIMLMLNIPPEPSAGRHGAFMVHKHPGPAFAYVLEGSVENQVDPDEPKTYNAGDFWYEPAMHIHRLLRNLSDTRPAKILVFEVVPKGKPVSLSAK